LSTKQYFDAAVAAQIISDLETVLLYTELGGRAELTAKFSWAGPGASTYSFGLLQFDVGNNPSTHPFLTSIGFSSEQIKQLSQKGGLSAAQLAVLDAQLAKPECQRALEQFTSQQLQAYITYLDNALGAIQPAAPAMVTLIVATRELQLRLLDYINQFGPMESQGPMVKWLCGEPVSMPGGTLHLPANHTLNGNDIGNFILHTQYGVNYTTAAKSRQERLNNALAIIRSAAAQAAAATATAAAATATVAATVAAGGDGSSGDDTQQASGGQ
jgi:hypothetical protein